MGSMSRQLNVWVNDEISEFVAAEAAKLGVTKSRTVAILLQGLVAAAGSSK